MRQWACPVGGAWTGEAFDVRDATNPRVARADIQCVVQFTRASEPHRRNVSRLVPGSLV